MNKEKFKIIISYLLVFFWMIVIFLFSNVDSYNSNNASKGTIDKVIDKVDEGVVDAGIRDHHVSNEHKIALVNFLNFPLRKVMHFSEYLILSILLINALSLSKVKHTYIISILFCILYAFTDEYHQTFINGRTGQLLDVLIDSSGALIGSLIYYGGNKLIKKIKSK